MSRIDQLIADLAPQGVPHKPLGELGEFIRGRRFTKADYVDSGLGSIHYGEIYTHYGTTAASVHRFVRSDLKGSLRLARPGDLVIAATGENVQDVCKAVAWLGEEEVAVHDDCYILRHEQDPTFMAYFFQSARFHDQKAKYASESKLARVSGANLAKIVAPAPPLAVQREIVSVLDRLSALQANLEAELTAEIQARREQFVHYRDSLLTFEAHLSLSASVRWTTLSEVVRNLDSQRRPVTRAERTPGPYPYYGANGVQDRVASYLFDGTFLLIGEDGSVMTRDRRPVINWATGQIWVNNHAHVLAPKDDSVSLRYLYFYLQTVDVGAYVTGGTQPKLNQGNLNRIPVPVPPRREQDRIVAALDGLDATMSELLAALPAEISARQKQYAYYRDKLLSFEELAA